MSTPWKARFQHKGATLYLGDALEIAPCLRKADCIVTDPPYLLESGGNKTGEMSGKFARGTYDNSGSFVDAEISWCQIMQMLCALIDQGHLYVMANNRNLLACLAEAKSAGLRFHNILTWDKGTATPNRWYMKNSEFTCMFFKGKAQQINDCGSKQLVRVPNVLRGKHPTEKPVELMQHYIRNSTRPGDLVMDPFMGCGTTGIAALVSGRRFIGIEKDPKHFETACVWIEEEYDRDQGSMFEGAQSYVG